MHLLGGFEQLIHLLYGQHETHGIVAISLYYCYSEHFQQLPLPSTQILISFSSLS